MGIVFGIIGGLIVVGIIALFVFLWKKGVIRGKGSIEMEEKA